MPGRWAAANPGQQRIFTPAIMPAYRCRVPVQHNEYDCGLFVLNHIEFFIHGVSELAAGSAARDERWLGQLVVQEPGQQHEEAPGQQQEEGIAAATPPSPPYPAFLAINIERVKVDGQVVGPAPGFLRRGWFSPANPAALRGELVHLLQERMLAQAVDK